MSQPCRKDTDLLPAPGPYGLLMNDRNRSLMANVYDRSLRDPATRRSVRRVFSPKTALALAAFTCQSPESGGMDSM
jgi:hypothetical protein